MAVKYKSGGVTVTIGRSQDVSLPPQVFRARLECMHFDTDKAFLLPMSIPGIRNIKTYYDQHAGLTVLVNGHTDLVGDAQYNLQLSNERAQSVAAYLQNKVDDWMQWYDAPIQSKRWGAVEDQAMRDKLVEEGQSPPSDRRSLVAAYMALEGTTLPADATLVTHGCGLFHPIDQTSAADQGNRRVEIFLFEGPVDPAPQSPCPSPGCTEYPQWVGLAIEDVDLCKPLPVKKQLRIKLIDSDENPRSGVQYQLKLGGQTMSGTTGEDGMIVQDIPDGVTDGELTWDDFTRPIAIESLPDAKEVAGAQPRLRNLGFGALEAAAGVLDDLTRLAIMRFQNRHDLDPSGDLDDPTAAKLKERHGS